MAQPDTSDASAQADAKRCRQCDGPITNPRRRSYCSAECTTAARSEKTRAYYAAIEAGLCRRCQAHKAGHAVHSNFCELCGDAIQTRQEAADERGLCRYCAERARGHATYPNLCSECGDRWALMHQRGRQ